MLATIYQKPREKMDDVTLLLSDVAGKAISQVEGFVEIEARRRRYWVWIPPPGSPVLASTYTTRWASGVSPL